MSSQIGYVKFLSRNPSHRCSAVTPCPEIVPLNNCGGRRPHTTIPSKKLWLRVHCTI